MRVEQTEQEDLFSAFESWAEIIGFIYSTYGAEGLRHMLSLYGKTHGEICALAGIKFDPYDDPDEIIEANEYDEQAADTLEAMGLAEAAAIVRHHIEHKGRLITELNG